MRVNGLHDGCYIRPLVYLGYGEMGLNPLPCPVNVSVAAWPWGTYLGDEGVANGVSCKISSWRRHDPNAVPTAAKGTGMYANSSLAKVEALKAGYDEAILLAPNGDVSECTGENIFIVRDGVLFTPPTSDAGALDGITQDSVETIARDLGYEVRHEPIIRTDLYLADEAFLTGTAAEVVPIRAVDDRAGGRRAPGQDHQGDPADLLRHRAGRGRSVQGVAGPCRLTPTPTATAGSATPMPTATARTPTTSPSPTCPRRSTSSTPSCATGASRRASPSRSTTSCGWPSSSTTSASPTSRAGGRAPTPRTSSSSPGPRRS